MKTKILIFAICMFCTYRTYTQTLHDFTVTDVTGQQHRLYDDYLNKNKIVVIKFFFLFRYGIVESMNVGYIAV